MKIIEIDGEDQEDEIQDYLGELTGARSVSIQNVTKVLIN